MSKKAIKMRIGIIGPNLIKKVSISQVEKRKELLVEIAEIIAQSGNEIVLTPDKGSLLEFFGTQYLKFGGKKIWIVAPMKDDAKDYLNLEIGEIIDCDKWYRQPSKFSEESDLYVCVGYSSGVLSEIGASRYFNPKKIIIVKEFVTSNLPKEINQSINLSYIHLKELETKLKFEAQNSG